MSEATTSPIDPSKGSLIVCASVSHGNTRKVADAMAEVLDAEVVCPDDVDATHLGEYELVGFGSGIFFMSFHPSLRDLVRRLPAVQGRRAFLFDTSGSREPPLLGYTGRLSAELARKGYDVVGAFACRGFDTWLPLRLVGGINRGRPNAADLDRARRFAAQLSTS